MKMKRQRILLRRTYGRNRIFTHSNHMKVLHILLKHFNPMPISFQEYLLIPPKDQVICYLDNLYK